MPDSSCFLRHHTHRELQANQHLNEASVPVTEAGSHVNKDGLGAQLIAVATPENHSAPSLWENASAIDIQSLRAG